MAGVKISNLPAAGVANLTDTYPAVQAGVTKKESLQQLLNLFQPNVVLSNPGNPNGLVAGTVYQLLWDSLGQALYVATTTGNSATTVWTLVGASAFNFVPAVVAATTGALTVVYNNGAGGVGATLTNNGTQAALVIDGVTIALNQRILVKNQVAPAQNGIYIATVLGSGSTNWVMTRALDYDSPSQIQPGDTIVVESGTVNGTTSWVETAVVTTIGTSSISFSQLTASPSAFLSSTLPDGQIYIGNSSNVGTPVTITGNATLSDTGVLTISNGAITPVKIAANSGNGVPVQIIQAQTTTPISVTTSSPISITGLSITITPSLSTSKILLRAMINFGVNILDNGFLRFYNGAAGIGVGTSTGARTPCTAQVDSANANECTTVTLEWEDSPATNTAITYSVQAWTSGANQSFINASVNDSNTASIGRPVSTFTAIEVK